MSFDKSGTIDVIHFLLLYSFELYSRPFLIVRNELYVVDAVEQRDGKHPLRELEERSLKPYTRR